MNKRAHTNSDSLELLLDTVCSMFGAILLIAILVALMARTATVESATEHASVEILQRKIATAEADLAETQRLTVTHRLPAGSPAEGLAEQKIKLEQALAAAREKLDQARFLYKDQVAMQSVDFGQEGERLNSNLRSIKHKLEELTNTLKTQNQNTTRMSERTAELSKLIQQEKKSRIVTLRFPKERATTKRSFAFIFKFGKVYPLLDIKGNENKTSLLWTDNSPDSKLTLPVQNLGWIPEDNKTELNNLLKSIPRGNYYLACYVYPDSFKAFKYIEAQARSMQLDCGIDFCVAGSDLIWASKGTSPPPQ